MANAQRLQQRRNHILIFKILRAVSHAEATFQPLNVSLKQQCFQSSLAVTCCCGNSLRRVSVWTVVSQIFTSRVLDWTADLSNTNSV